jgi:hypothetical protein
MPVLPWAARLDKQRRRASRAGQPRKSRWRRLRNRCPSGYASVDHECRPSQVVEDVIRVEFAGDDIGQKTAARELIDDRQHRKARPSRVRSWRKSQGWTWPVRSGRSRAPDPSFSHTRSRLGCFCGTFSPSRRQTPLRFPPAFGAKQGTHPPAAVAAIGGRQADDCHPQRAPHHLGQKAHAAPFVAFRAPDKQALGKLHLRADMIDVCPAGGKG